MNDILTLFQVVHRDGLFNRTQNMLVGWGMSAGIILTTVAVNYQEVIMSYIF